MVILVSIWRLLTDSLRLSMDGVPTDIDVDRVSRLIEQMDGVVELHHLHIWAISTTQNALTVHVVINDVTCMEAIKSQIKQKLAVQGIAHATIEVGMASCSEHDCTCDE